MSNSQTMSLSSARKQGRESFESKIDRLFAKIRYPDSFYKISSIPSKPGTSIWNVDLTDK